MTAARPAGYDAGPRRAQRSANRPVLRPVLAHFTLHHAARIHVSIQQLAPVCRALPSYTFRAPKGRFAFRFPVKRIEAVGTYHLFATLRGKKLFSIHARRLAHGKIKRGGTANDCSRPFVTQAAFSISPPLVSSATSQLHVKSAHARSKSGGATIAGGPPAPDSNPVVRAVTLSDAPASVRPLLLALLALSIALLATAALPQHVLPAGRTAALLVQRRAYVAAAGIWLLVVVVVVTAAS